MILPHWICDMCTHSQVEVVVVFKAEMWDLQLEEETLCLFYICRRSVPSILPGKWNNQSTNIYKLYTIIPATLKQLQIDFSLAAFDVLYDRIVCTIATFEIFWFLTRLEQDMSNQIRRVCMYDWC